MTRLRPYWTVVPLAVFAVLLLLLGLRIGDSFSSVGWGFAGATVVRAVDLASERSRSRAAELERQRTDFDETRRLLYMALNVEGSEITATLVNALAHHGLGISVSEAMSILQRHSMPRHAVSLHADEERNAWINKHINMITKMLDEMPR